MRAWESSLDRVDRQGHNNRGHWRYRTNANGVARYLLLEIRLNETKSRKSDADILNRAGLCQKPPIEFPPIAHLPPLAGKVLRIWAAKSSIKKSSYAVKGGPPFGHRILCQVDSIHKLCFCERFVGLSQLARRYLPRKRPANLLPANDKNLQIYLLRG